MEFSLQSGKEILRRTPRELDAMLRDLPDSWTMQNEGPGTWSPYQVVGHMLHCEDDDWLDRAQVILRGDPEKLFDPIDREAGFDRFRDWTLSDLLDRFTQIRGTNLVLLDSMVSEHDLDRPGRHPDFGPVTLRQLMATWVVHDLNHLDQIVKTMSKQYRAAVGPWRAYLPILDSP
jgi:hypothetical protein